MIISFTLKEYNPSQKRLIIYKMKSIKIDTVPQTTSKAFIIEHVALEENKTNLHSTNY